MISEDCAGRLKSLIKRKRAGLITDEEQKELAAIYYEISKDPDVPAGLQVSAKLTLSIIISKIKSKEATA